MNITPLSLAINDALGSSLALLPTIYIGCTLAISKFYLVQSYRFLRGSSGAGDFCFTSKSSQALLRLAGLMYAASINDGTLFLVIALDFVGRWVEIGSAWLAKWRFDRDRADAAAPAAGAGCVQLP